MSYLKVKAVMVILFSAISVLLISSHALAEVTIDVKDAKVTFYSTIEVNNFYETYENSSGDDDTDFDLSIASTSRIGMKINKGAFNSHAEFGFGFPDDIGVYTRLLYGTWKMDAGTLVLGQNYTPYTWGTHEVSDDLNAFSGHGSLFDWRQPLVGFKFNNGFYLYAIKPADWGVTFQADSDVDNTLPKFAAGYDSWGDKFSYGFGAAYQTFDEKSDSLNFDDSINSGFIYFHGLYNPTKNLALSFNTHYGMNLAQFGTYKTDHQSADVFTTGQVEDTTAYGGFVEAGLTLPSCVVFAGVGYTVGDNDVWESKDDKLGYFINSYISLNEYITFIPEFSYTDNLDDRFGNEQDDYYFVGAMWRVDL